MNNDIILGVGLGNLKFGDSKEKVFKVFGKPNRIYQYSYTDSDDDLTERWYFDKFGFQLGFNKEEDWRLTTINIESDLFILSNKIFVGRERKDVLMFLHDINVHDISNTDESTIENPTHELISSDSLCVNFWFDDGILTAIQYSPFFIDEDTINWP